MLKTKGNFIRPAKHGSQVVLDPEFLLCHALYLPDGETVNHVIRNQTQVQRFPYSDREVAGNPTSIFSHPGIHNMTDGVPGLERLIQQLGEGLTVQGDDFDRGFGDGAHRGNALRSAHQLHLAEILAGSRAENDHV